ncbi:MAG: glycoside hydrolase family 15 protein [Candidatus Dormibacteria bacterium]
MSPSLPELTSSPLREYFCLADGQTAALVTTAGSCHYWCAPGFDGPLRLAQVLDWQRGGSVGVGPRLEIPARASWQQDSTILTISWGDRATMRCGLLDDGAGGSALCWILRGQPGLQVNLDLRSPTAGGAAAWMVDEGGARVAPGGPEDGPQGPLAVVTSAPIRPAGSPHMRLPMEGLVVWMGLPQAKGGLPPRLARARAEGAVAAAELAMAESAASDRAWLAALRGGPSLASLQERAPRWATDAIARSLLTIRSLQDRRSGLVVASPLTSIPQWPGSERAWDYRYAWLRDCADAGLALARGGAFEQARGIALGLARVMRADPATSAPVTRLNGQAMPPEHRLDYLDGYTGAAVRIGNAAAGQAQVDTLGEVARFAEVLDRGDGCPQPLLGLVGDLASGAARGWQLPDHGIWEVRGARRHYVHSKVLAWSALDSALRLAQRGRVDAQSAGQWAQARSAVAEAIRSHGTNAAGQLTMAFDDPSADSSTVAAYVVGYLPVGGGGAAATLDFVAGELQHGFLLARHHPERDGIAAPCSPFLFPSLWAVIAEARLGRRTAAVARLRAILDLAGPAGQLSEVADPGSMTMLGNYPQGQSHAAVVEAIAELWGAAGPTPAV